MVTLLLIVLVGCRSRPPSNPLADQPSGADIPSGPEATSTLLEADRSLEPTTGGISSPTQLVTSLSVTPQRATPRGATPRGQAVYAWQTSLVMAWNGPQANGVGILPYIFQYIMHDAVVKHLPRQPLAPGLAKSCGTAPHFTSATFQVRACADYLWDPLASLP